MSDSEETSTDESHADHEAETPAPALAGVAAKKSVEEWALAKGFLPQTYPRTTPAVVTGGFRGLSLAGNPVKHNPEFWKYAAARAGNGWVVGFEITEADFDAQIKKHTNLSHA